MYFIDSRPEGRMPPQFQPALLACAVALALTACSPEPNQDQRDVAQSITSQIAITAPWSRETAVGQDSGGAFMAITNSGGAPDRLTGGSSPFAAEVQIHTVDMTDGVMRMRQLKDGLEIPSGGSVTLRPGSFHIMLIGLKHPLKQGGRFRSPSPSTKRGSSMSNSRYNLSARQRRRLRQWTGAMADPTSQTNAGVWKRLRLVLWLAVALVIGAVLFTFYVPNRTGSSHQSTAYADTVGGAFSLTAPDGSTVTDQTLKGNPFAIFFGFTRCPDVCPTTLSRLAQLRRRMGDKGDKFEIVFVSVDPGYDSPEDIGRYVELFGTPIIGLTGSDQDVARVTKAYHAFYEKVPVEGGDYTIDHTAAVYLMDRGGRLQSMIDYHENPKTSLEKLERLVG